MTLTLAAYALSLSHPKLMPCTQQYLPEAQGLLTIKAATHPKPPQLRGFEGFLMVPCTSTRKNPPNKICRALAQES